MAETNKRAAVLGASEEGGTGWAIAQALHKGGFSLTLGARRLVELERLAAPLGARAPAPFTAASW